MGERSRESDDRLAAELKEAQRLMVALESATTGLDLAQLTDALLDGFSLLSSQGVHLEVNPALREMTGFRRDELIGAGPPHSYWPPEDKAAIQDALAKTVVGAGQTRALTFRRKNGERFPVLVTPSVLKDDCGEITAVYSLVKDMTALFEAEAALAESEQLFRLTFDLSPIGAALVDTDFRFRRVNARFSRMTGYSVEELLERGFSDITHPDDIDADMAQVKRLAAGDIGEYARQKRYVRKDGSVAWGDAVVRPVLGASGNAMAFVALVNDITERRLTDRLLSAPSEIMEILATPLPVPQIVLGIVAALKQATGLDAVGLRLREDDDYPFAAAIGYSDEFLQAENTLTVRLPAGGLCRDEDGSLSLECTCGLVLSGCAVPTNSPLTPSGSAWTNDSSTLLDLPPEDDPKINPRNRCVSVGFQSFALVPLRAGEEIIGLLHLADRRKDRFTAESVRFLEGVGASIGIALRHRQAEEQIHRQNEDLLRLNDELAARATALEEANATITRIAATDDLTGLANRRHFYETLERAVSLTRRHGSPLALVSLDLDGLKQVNDSAGHAAGDAVLRSFAALLGALCRTEDLAARLGGDEFGLLLPGIDLGGARRLAERVLKAVHSCAALTQIGVTASAGVAAWRSDERPDDLLRRADEALYAAKRRGGDRVAGDVTVSDG